MQRFSKTKIVATIGPSCWDDTLLKDMISSGLSVARINASFANFEELDRVSKQIRRLSPRVAIMLDTKGFKIRVTGFEEEIELKKDEVIYLGSEENQDPNVISLTYPNLHNEVGKGTQILLDDGNMQIEVLDIQDTLVQCKVLQGGILKPKKTVNIPKINLNFPTLTEKDREDINFAKDNKFDFVSLSFVRNKEDIQVVRKILEGSDIKVISKIENQEGIDNFDEILEATDGIMIARGDLGVETALENVPILQKQMIYKCRAVGKPVIVATQMLESMKDNIRPTRAEVSDVANAVMDGTDAVMLSAETSTGKHPVQSVAEMRKIALNTESVMSPSPIMGHTTASLETDEICKQVFDLTNSLDLKGVIVISQTGKSVASLSRHRPNIPIWAISNSLLRIRQDLLLRGVKGYYTEEISDDRDICTQKAVETVYSYGELDLNDKIAIISGSSIRHKIDNTILEIITVKDVLTRN
jgi:pyruvate kinase